MNWCVCPAHQRISPQVRKPSQKAATLPKLRRKFPSWTRLFHALGGWGPRASHRFCAVASAALLLAASLPLASAADEPDVQVAPLGDGALHIHVHARVRASRDVIWNTLTDYDHFGQFVPGLSASHLLSCQSGDCVVEQKWRIPVLWLSVPISVTVLSMERPPSRLGVHLLGGDLNRLDGAYQIDAADHGPIDLRWDGSLKGPAYLPQWISTPIIKNLARAQFRAMVREIEKRSATLAAPSRETSPLGIGPLAACSEFEHGRC